MTIRSFLFVYALIFSISAQAQDMSAFTLDPAAGAAVSFESQYMAPPPGHGDLTIEEQKGFAKVPVFKREDRSLSVMVKAERTELGERLVFEKRGIEIPEEFGTAEVGVAWAQKQDGDNRFGASAAIGSAGQRLLDNGLTPIISVNMSWDRPASESRSWLYFISYSNNRPILNNIPLPGIGYSIKSAKSRTILGLPFLFYTAYPDPWQVTAALSPFGAFFEGGYRFWGPLQTFVGGGWTPRSYQNLIKGSADRLLFNKKEIGTGLRFLMGRQGSVSLAYMYNLGRQFMLGRSISDDNADSVSIENSGGFQLRARLTF
ncbi:MAG TPA: hypothetical protein VM432_05755 [Bdellovibrionales bacterium]|nr:hypothetical protein [Bdellovibrionales bacterium]